MKYSENAVSAKVHALFAKSLKNTDYETMLNFHTEEELFNYLHNETYYSENLNNLPAVKLSRSRFENVLRKASLDKQASICRFQKLIGDETYKYFIKKDEIETIIYCARHLDTVTIANLLQRPDIYKKEQVIFGEELQKATSFNEFLTQLNSTPYGKIINPFLSSNILLNDISLLERILYNNLYIETEKIIKRNYKGNSRKEIIDYLKFVSDMNTVNVIYRLTVNYSGSEVYKENFFVSEFTAFTTKQINSLKKATTGLEVLEILKTTVYGRYFLSDIQNIDSFIRNLIINKSLKNIRFSQNPVLVVFSYDTVEKNEIQNIIHIIEGIKYGLSPDEISEIIVKGGC